MMFSSLSFWWLLTAVILSWCAQLSFCQCSNHRDNNRELIFDIGTTTTQQQQQQHHDDDNNSTTASSSTQRRPRIVTAVLPFTSSQKTQSVTYFRDTKTRRRVPANLGYSHMSATLLAMKHFNERNTQVVPELKDLTDNCNEYFDLNATKITDSQGSRVATLSTMLELAIQHNHCPDAIIDGYYFQEAPSLTLGNFADALQLPFVSSGGFDLGLTDSEIEIVTTATTTTTTGSVLQQQQDEYPVQSSRIFADVYTLGEAAIKYLQHIQRDNYVGILHSINPTSIQIHESIKAQATGFNIQTYSMDYIPPTSKYHGMVRTVETSLKGFLQTGYRTILVILDDFKIEIPLLAKAAKSLNMKREDYVWILLGNFDVEYFLYWIEMVSDPDIAELLLGVAAIQPVEGFTKNKLDDPFYQAWKQQANDSEFLNLLESKNPKTNPNDVGYFNPNDVLAVKSPNDNNGRVGDNVAGTATTVAEADEGEVETYFNSMAPGLGSGFVYDSVIALGLGYCAAEREAREAQQQLATRIHTTIRNNATDAIVRGIQKSSFTGASGHVTFDSNGPYPGQRLGHSVSFAVYNIKLPSISSGGEEDLEVIQVTDILRGTDRPMYRQWESIRPFVHSDGTTTAPKLLRAIADQNYLTRGVRSWGLSLFGLSMFINLSAIGWIFLKRNHRVIKAGQPEFLYMVTLGSTLFAATIIPNSFDESYGWNAEQLSRACNVSPWFIMIGFMLIYSGLWVSSSVVSTLIFESAKDQQTWRLFCFVPHRRFAFMFPFPYGAAETMARQQGSTICSCQNSNCPNSDWACIDIFCCHCWCIVCLGCCRRI